MVVLIAEIEGNCLYIIVSIVLFWHRSDLFNVSLHNQMLLHITLSKLVFTSHCICFYYIMICPVSSAYTIGVVHLHDLDVLPLDFEQVIIPVILFTLLFANQITIFSMSAAHVPLVLSCLLNPKALAPTLNRSFLWLFVSWLFVSCFFF